MGRGKRINKTEPDLIHMRRREDKVIEIDRTGEENGRQEQIKNYSI